MGGTLASKLSMYETPLMLVQYTVYFYQLRVIVEQLATGGPNWYQLARTQKSFFITLFSSAFSVEKQTLK